jgi:hypothetical protein
LDLGPELESEPVRPRGPEATITQVLLAARLAAGALRNDAEFTRTCATLARVDVATTTTGCVTAAITTLLDRYLPPLFEVGWQPADVAHAVKREWKAKAGRLAIAAIAADSRRTDAIARAPASWLDQLQDLGVYEPSRRVIIGGHADFVQRWSRAERLHADEAITIELQLLSFVMMAPKLSLLVDPPSAWGRSNRGAAPTSGRTVDDVDARALKVIRALLAKAEASTFDAEAESFTVKAQELMTRHSIDAAVLASSGATGRASGVESRRVHIDSPYADEKATFLSIIGKANGVRSVWEQWAGFVTTMGFPIDLHVTDVLFTSLLVQATAASAVATAVDRRQRTPSFRRAFLLAYAIRIGERLQATKAQTESAAQAEYGADLLPILADRSAAVDEAYEQAFPDATPMKSRRLDASGWHSGRSAAEQARIGPGEAIEQR